MKLTLSRNRSAGRLLTVFLMAAGLVALSDDEPIDLTKGLSKETKEVLESMEKEAPRLIAGWKEARSLQEEMKKRRVIFGIEARPVAERELKALEASYSTVLNRYRADRDAFQEKATKDVAAKREDVHRIRTRMGDNPSEATLTRLSEANAEVDQLDCQIRALNDLHKTLSNVMSLVPTTTTLLGFNPRDVDSLKLAEKYSTVVDARKKVKDAEVDLEALAGEPAGGATTQKKASIERSLERAKAELDREVDKVTKTQTRDIDKFTKQLESVEKRIAEMEKFKRKVPDRLSTQAAELRMNIASLEKEVAVVNKVAGKGPEAAAKK